VSALRPLLIGAIGAAVYWLAAQIWPASVAVILSMLATKLVTAENGALPAAAHLELRVFYLLIKYSALMALSAAKLPFAAPANLPLGLIMICGYSASFALALSITAMRPEQHIVRISNSSWVVALIIGFAPAALLGIPGLIGLAAAIVAALSVIAHLRIKRRAASSATQRLAQWLTELCFYLGALATWSYI
jgi:adenosylcobinamide-GDP ribazoletransferase